MLEIAFLVAVFIVIGIHCFVFCYYVLRPFTWLFKLKEKLFTPVVIIRDKAEWEEVISSLKKLGYKWSEDCDIPKSLPEHLHTYNAANNSICIVVDKTIKTIYLIPFTGLYYNYEAKYSFVTANEFLEDPIGTISNP